MISRSALQMSTIALLTACLTLVPSGGEAATTPEQLISKRRPNVLLLSIDTLRADRVSAYGYERNTTPMMDRWIKGGVQFETARTVEPLTSPALCSMLTSRHPHQHGSTRNGLRMRPGLDSLPRVLHAEGYRTTAFIGNWTLRNKLSGLGEHFEEYNEVLTRKRWFGLVRSEADAEDITERTIDWLKSHVESDEQRPFFVWAHYVEPHAPYKLHKEFLPQLGLTTDDNLRDSDRYDTEVAFVDESIGQVLASLGRLGLKENTIVVLTSDHGESFGEHGYWGHGRNLFEQGLRIPMSITWSGHIRPTRIEAPALITDLAPTLLGLLNLNAPPAFRGYNWTSVLDGTAADMDRITRYEAHRGAVISRHDSELARRAGLIEVGLIRGSTKEIFHVKRDRSSVFNLADDPGELSARGLPDADPTVELTGWMRLVYEGLISFDDVRPAPLDKESIEALRSLGYVE